MSTIQTSTGKGNTTSNTTTVWDRIVNLETKAGVGGIPIKEQIDGLTTQLTEKANKHWIDVTDAPYNAKGDGIADDTQAIKDAIRDWEAMDGGQLDIPVGRYNISSSLNLTTYFTKTTLYQRKTFNMSPSAELIATANIPNLINIEANANGGFIACVFNIGVLNMNSKTGNGLRVVNTSDCKINVGQSSNAVGTGILVDQSGSRPQGCFNNLWDIQVLSNNTKGFEVLGSPLDWAYGFQGNIVRIAQIIANVNGMIIDSNSPGNSVLNTFHIGVSEHNTGAGVIDQQGSNIWFIGNTNANTNGGFILPSGALGIPFVIGSIPDGLYLNGQIGRIENISQPVGPLPTPSVPASGVHLKNPYSQTVRVHIKGSGVVAVYVGDVDTLQTNGLFILRPGEDVVLSYTTEPTWAWFGM